jgi:hypothetical protein
MKKNLMNTVIIFIITTALLESVSFAVLKFYSENLSSKLSIFKQTNKNGHIEVSKSSVLPVKENVSIHWRTDEFSVTINTNNRGLREKYDVENKDVDVAFFGDSFAFGHGVEGIDRYSYIFSQDPFFLKSKVVNFSYINGFQPEHYEYYLRNNVDLHPKHVIIGLYLGNDLGSDIEETKYDWKNNSLEIPYRFIARDGTFYNNPMVYKFPLNHLVKASYFVTLFIKTIGKTHYRSYLFNDKLKNPVNQPNEVELELGKETLTKNRAILSLARIQKIINERGGKLTIILIPQNFFFNSDITAAHIHINLKNRINEVTQGYNILKATKDVCEKLSLDCYDPSAILKEWHYFKEDAHWNSEGHFIVGSVLAKYIREQYYKSKRSQGDRVQH